MHPPGMVGMVTLPIFKGLFEKTTGDSCLFVGFFLVCPKQLPKTNNGVFCHREKKGRHLANGFCLKGIS